MILITRQYMFNCRAAEARETDIYAQPRHAEVARSFRRAIAE